MAIGSLRQGEFEEVHDAWRHTATAFVGSCALSCATFSGEFVMLGVEDTYEGEKQLTNREIVSVPKCPFTRSDALSAIAHH